MTMPAPVPPIVVDEDGDIEVYSSVEDVRAWLEAYDVKEGRYEAFDSHGRRLEFAIQGYAVTGMRIDPGLAEDPVELRRRLLVYVKSAGASDLGITEPDAATLSELLSGILERQDAVRQSHWGDSALSLRESLKRLFGGRA
ncbi:MAG: hypothetical protein ACJ71Z_09975 [Aeromicrobium sp.]